MFGLPTWVVALLAIGLLAVLVVFRQRIVGAIAQATSTVRYRVKHAVVSFLMGGSHPNTTRLQLLVVVGSALVAIVGLVALAVQGARTSASSAPVMNTIFGIISNPWAWLLAVVVLFRQLLFFGDRLFARVSAAKTGYSSQSIRRLAEEAKQPDLNDCERVLVQSGDSPEQIKAWLLDAFEGYGHEDPTFSPGGDADDGADRRRRDPDTDVVPADRAHQADPIDVEPVTDDEDDETDFWTQLRLFRLELASAVDLTGVLWRFLVPTLLAFVFLLLWVQIWVQIWVLPIIIAVSVFVGGLYYWLVDLRHRRRLESLREQNEPTRWTDLAILTKRVEVPETTMYYGFHDGNVYASEDKEELAETVAYRAIDRLEGRQPAPAIEEKYAYLLKRYLPLLEAWKENYEKPAIMDQLIDTVADAPEGLMPRDLLIEEVVEYDRRYVAWGLLFIGRGRDPKLVREAYEDLVEIHALVETPVTITDSDTGEEREVLAVSLGDERMPPDVAQLRGEFSSLFGKQALNTRYTAPDVDVATDPAPYIRPEHRESTTSD